MKFLMQLLIVVFILNSTLSQQLQEQIQLDPVNETREILLKDLGKRTISLNHHHYVLGKHIGVNPRGIKYLLGYSPINVKYVPVIKPVTVLKPVIQQNVKQLWKPIMTPNRQYLPFSKPSHSVNQVNQEWKPIIPMIKPIIPVQEPKPLHIVPTHEPKPLHILPQTIQFALKPLAHNVHPVKTPLHNYFYFQTPVAHPNLIPNPQFPHVKRPQLPVLPLGATFPSSVLHQHRVHPQLFFPEHFYQPGTVPQHLHPIVHSLNPLLENFAYTQPTPQYVHAQPIVPSLQEPIPVNPEPVQPTPHYPTSIEVHGNHHLLQLHNQHFLPSHSHSSIPESNYNITPYQEPEQVHAQQTPSYASSAEFQGNLHQLFQLHNQNFHTSHFHQQNPEVQNLQSQEDDKQASQFPGAVEFHGTHHLFRLSNQHFQPSQFYQLNQEEQSLQHQDLPNFQHQGDLNFQKQEAQNAQYQEVKSIHQQIQNSHQENQNYQQNQAPFNQEAAVQPGQTDLQLPLYLPNHPTFPQNYDLNYLQHTAENQFPSFSTNNQVLRPSNLLEPPLHHEHDN